MFFEVTSFVLCFRAGSRKRRVLAHAQAHAVMLLSRAGAITVEVQLGEIKTGCLPNQSTPFLNGVFTAPKHPVSTIYEWLAGLGKGRDWRARSVARAHTSGASCAWGASNGVGSIGLDKRAVAS